MRLALLGFAAVYVPLVVLLGVVTVTEEQELVDTGGGPQLVEEGGGDPPWAVATTLLLAPVAAAASWVLAGRAVRPIVAVTAAADSIMATSPSRRIGEQSAPTEVAELAASFDRMLDRLDRAAQARTAFLEDVSHELRTPLAVLETNTDVLLNAVAPTPADAAAGDPTEGATDAAPGPDVGEVRRGLERNRRAVTRLAGAVDDLLRAARNEAAQLDVGPLDLARLAREAGDQWRPRAAAAGLALRVDAPGPAPVEADRPAVERLVDNLLDNAVRHARGATAVTVTVAVPASGEVELSVADDGPGLPAGHEEEAFGRRWTGGGDTAGEGLGLAIATQVVTAHGGTLTLDRAHTPGARFVARFPAPAHPA
jgi:signal transduction histidine kinase